MKFKQVTTVTYTQEVELTEEEAQEIIGIPSVREKELNQAWEEDIREFILDTENKLVESVETLKVETEITFK